MNKQNRSWINEYETIISLYNNGLSPTDIAKKYNVRRETIKNILIRKLGKLRSKSEAGKLSASQGKKDKCIKGLILAAKTKNRFHPAKSQKGENNANWIKDRTKLKQKRLFAEEKWFFKDVLKDKNYTCELTNTNGLLSVHHIDGVWKFPEKQFDKNNCIVILNSIHKKFHKMYGNRTEKKDWDLFVNNKEYFDCVVLTKKKNYIPFVDRSGMKNGRLLIIKKIESKWMCKCDCGKEVFILSGNLKKTKSCGCLKIEKLKERLLKNPIWIHSSKSNKK